MSKSKWSKERDAVLGTLFGKLISLETGIRSVRNQKIALDFCFSVTQNHTYLSCDEHSVRSHFRGIVAKLEVHGQDAKAECLSSALDDLLLHPVAADKASCSSSSKYGPVTSHVLAVLRGLEGNVSSLDWKGSVSRQQQQEDGVLLLQLQHDFADTDDDCSEYSEQSSSDLSMWGDEPEQLPPLSHRSDNDEASCSAAAPLDFDRGANDQLQIAMPLQQYSLGQHWQMLHHRADAAGVSAGAGVACACLAERAASGAYSSTVIVEESTVVCETLLMLAGLSSRIFSVEGDVVAVSADIAVASVSPSACKSWLQSWAQVGSMCRRCVAVMHTDYEVSSPVIQVDACRCYARPFSSSFDSSQTGLCRLPARPPVPLLSLCNANAGACSARPLNAPAAIGRARVPRQHDCHGLHRAAACRTNPRSKRPCAAVRCRLRPGPPLQHLQLRVAVRNAPQASAALLVVVLPLARDVCAVFSRLLHACSAAVRCVLVCIGRRRHCRAAAAASTYAASRPLNRR